MKRRSSQGSGDFVMPIATKLILGYLLIIVLTSAIFCVVGVRIIGNRIVSEAQAKVHTDLYAAREIYLSRLNNVNDVVRFTADRYLLISGLLTGDRNQALEKLGRIRQREGLDILRIADETGKVLLRTNNPDVFGDGQIHGELVRAVLQRRRPAAATTLVSEADLRRESSLLAESACIQFIDTPKARPRKETEETDGMMLEEAAPIFDNANRLVAIINGGILLNRSYGIVDKIKHTVFQGVKYRGKDIGTATIFQDDVRISTNVENEDGTRAIGTRVAEEVYNRVVKEGKPWIGRAYVVNDWYITAYEPIRDINDKIIGILYVGLLEQKYTDMKRRTILVFMGITLLGAVISITLSCYISSKISGSLKQLVAASKEVTHGNLTARVEINSHDELRELAESFNTMAVALQQRDQKLKDFARKRIMESERLAVIGQLAADVAHELNNPLQGIVAYSHLLLERMPGGNSGRQLVGKIVVQANRCTGIVRGLLDFARQRKPHKRPSDINVILQECVSLVENQALFHNIEIVRDLGGNLPSVVLDPSQIQQVFTNIVINAAESMGGSGRLTLATRYDPVENCIEVEFSDTGHGISPQNVERMFDPFFTTKEVGHGTGLGLAISHGIVKEHKGTISVESEVDKGTALLVRLPVSNGEGSAEYVESTEAADH